MVRVVFPASGFERKLVKFLRCHQGLDPDVDKAVKLLEKDLFAPQLNTHKLHGKLAKSYGCNINYQYRIVFSFDEKYVYLENIGSHDDVY